MLVETMILETMKLESMLVESHEIEKGVFENIVEKALLMDVGIQGDSLFIIICFFFEDQHPL